ncbi:hypothetical protein IQ230_17375 [Gloeocapsopsis crepidinum LEGE 06123]|uniref:Uncharacterized protein n=1 Tax=Gloeocapsopsis crepidinum LEGE 06123 TaxID=588587 RepID=A0ABR9UUW5_9CHRO|nr:hypothetical protein [Gloeocapsopsis crepidinum]MBE9192091.1 hypothetical protein [Gloeocapsopsis crepidinum LEGE 06123]
MSMTHWVCWFPPVSFLLQFEPIVLSTDSTSKGQFLTKTMRSEQDIMARWILPL